MQVMNHSAYLIKVTSGGIITEVLEHFTSSRLVAYIVIESQFSSAIFEFCYHQTDIFSLYQIREQV